MSVIILGTRLFGGIFSQVQSLNILCMSLFWVHDFSARPFLRGPICRQSVLVQVLFCTNLVLFDIQVIYSFLSSFRVKEVLQTCFRVARNGKNKRINNGTVKEHRTGSETVYAEKA